MNFIIYDPATGEIVSWGRGGDLPETEGALLVIESDAAASTHYVLNGAPVAYTYAQGAVKAAMPNLSCVWSNVSFAWQDQRSLVQSKVDKRAEIKGFREAAMYSSFTWDGSSFDCDSNSRALIQGAVVDAVLAAQMSTTFTTAWTLADNTVRPLTGSQVIQMGLALSAYTTTTFTKGQALQSSIESATSSEQLESIQWA